MAFNLIQHYQLMRALQRNEKAIFLLALVGFINSINTSASISLADSVSFNLNKPNQGFFGSVIERDVRMNLFAKGIYQLNFDWDLVPGIQFNIQGSYRELLIGSSVKHTLIDRLGEYRALYAGAFYRNRDAAFVSAGMGIQNWFVGISYDVNFSKLVPADNFPGYQAPISAEKMAEFIVRFALTGQEWMNGKIIPVSLSTP